MRSQTWAVCLRFRFDLCRKCVDTFLSTPLASASCSSVYWRVLPLLSVREGIGDAPPSDLGLPELLGGGVDADPWFGLLDEDDEAEACGISPRAYASAFSASAMTPGNGCRL